MGICCSKKSPNFSSPAPKLDPQIGKTPYPNPQIDKTPEEKPLIKEKPIINHRKCNEIDRQLVEEIAKPDRKPISGDSNLKTEISSDSGTGNSNLINNGGIIVRTSSCTRDELDAILIQCGRLSRSSSAVQTPARKHSGSKRSFDFDQEAENAEVATARESRRLSRPSPNRRRTPSREREREQNQQSQRSGSRERSNNGGGRRVSRSPGRRSESPMTATCHNPSGSGVSRPGKMVSVPATDKSSNGEGPIAVAVKKAAAKRSAAASPRRSRSPAARANARVGNDNQNQSQSLSRSNSRKAEQSPYRRNPLGEIDQNAQKQGLENVKNSKTNTKEPPQVEENARAPPKMTNNIAVNVVVPSGPEPLKPQTLTRTRASRLSRDLDNVNIETENPSPPSSYTALLLKDIQNFHNKPVSLPQCISKACSILDEIADLNSSNSTEGPAMEKHAMNLLEHKEPPLVETEVVGTNDLMEPSFQKYVTVKRGNTGREEEESSGSNSFTGGPQHWVSSSLWETNSTDSNDCRASSSRLNTRGEDRKKREIDCPKMGIGHGRSIHSRPAITTATI